jgi:tRNA 2-thiouridine synthesizing protein D
MKFMLAVLGDPNHCPAPISAYRFADAVLTAGHEIHRVFFYHGGVLVANALAEPPQDEPSIAQLWQHFGNENNIELVACIASASRRGIFDDSEAQRYGKPASSILPGFILGGLGQLIEGTLVSDRTVTFGS